MADIEHMNWFRERWEYVNGTFGRPNLVTFSNNSGRYFIDGDDQLWLPEGVEGEDFVILSDHNRSSAPFQTERIGVNKRMINGRMRSYHVADKLSISLSWDDLPSRAYSILNGYETWSGQQKALAMSNPVADPITKFTADGGAGGVEMLKWWQEHYGSFWVFFSFDGVPVTLSNSTVFNGYSRVYEMQITDFDYEISKRSRGIAAAGGGLYHLDFWNVSLSLEEV